MNREQLAWAAGIIDGEGTFCNTKNTRKLKDGTNRTYYISTLKVQQTAKYGGVPTMLTRLSKIFGGNVLGPYKKKKEKWADVYSWSLYGEPSREAAASMWAWLGEQKKLDALKMMGEYFENKPPYEWGPRPKPAGFLRNRKRDKLGRLLPNDRNCT